MTFYFSRYFSYKNLPLAIAGANFFLSLLLTSCNKSSQIGLDVQPDNSLMDLEVFDTLTLNTKTVSSGGVLSDETATQGISNNVLVGKYIDPVFGTTAASLFTQLRFKSAAPNFGTNPIIDSIVLSVVYSNGYGVVASAPQTINVYELSDDMVIDNSYYTNDTIAFISTDLASAYSFTPQSSDTLRIPLSNTVGQQLLNAHASNNMVSDATFQSFFKGLFITAQNTSGLSSGDGNILRFDMENDTTNVIVYYHNNTQSSQSFSFSFNSVARLTHFDHDYSNAITALSDQLSSSSPVQNDVVFIQPMGGTKVKIELPYLTNLLDLGKVGINKAELIIKADASSIYQSDVFSKPEKLTLVAINNDGSTYQLTDAADGDSYFGGTYDASNNQYTFNIAKYLQQVLNGKLPNKGLYLIPVNEVVTPNRLVLGGGGNGSSYKMKLNIAQTKLP